MLQVKKNVAGKSKNVGKNNAYLKFLKFYCTYWRIEYMCYTIFANNFYSIK